MSLKLVPNLLFPKQHFESQDDLFSFLAQALQEEGLVAEGFLGDLQESEVRNPSAMPSDPPILAIPHAHEDFVLDQGLAVVSLDQAVDFVNFVDGRTKLGVQLVFLPTINQLDQEVEIMTRLEEWGREVKNRKNLLACQSQEDLLEVIKDLLK